jgi:hypothetical protein
MGRCIFSPYLLPISARVELLKYFNVYTWLALVAIVTSMQCGCELATYFAKSQMMVFAKTPLGVAFATIVIGTSRLG